MIQFNPTRGTGKIICTDDGRTFALRESRIIKGNPYEIKIGTPVLFTAVSTKLTSRRVFPVAESVVIIEPDEPGPSRGPR